IRLGHYTSRDDVVGRKPGRAGHGRAVRRVGTWQDHGRDAGAPATPPLRPRASSQPLTPTVPWRTASFRTFAANGANTDFAFRTSGANGAVTSRRRPDRDRRRHLDAATGQRDFESLTSIRARRWHRIGPGRRCPRVAPAPSTRTPAHAP